MATTRMKAREQRRITKSQNAYQKREALKKKIKDATIPFEEKMQLVATLNKMPRDESKIRVRNRCALCGRPRGVYRKFALCRCHLRKAMMRGDITGAGKASW
jgi:small subunit ribosomal protein S14